MKTSFDNIIAMNLLGLAVATSIYGARVVSEIPAMQTALIQSNQPKLYPMPDVLEFSTSTAVAIKDGK